MISFYPIFRWRFVIHSGIDGFSRMIVFMECSTNNRASTVCTLFRNAVHTSGLPSRVRSDKGGENADVAWLMLSHPLRGPGRGRKIANDFTFSLTKWKAKSSVSIVGVYRQYTDLSYLKTSD